MAAVPVFSTSSSKVQDHQIPIKKQSAYAIHGRVVHTVTRQPIQGTFVIVLRDNNAFMETNPDGTIDMTPHMQRLVRACQDMSGVGVADDERVYSPLPATYSDAARRNAFWCLYVANCDARDRGFKTNLAASKTPLPISLRALNVNRFDDFWVMQKCDPAQTLEVTDGYEQTWTRVPDASIEWDSLDDS